MGSIIGESNMQQVWNLDSNSNINDRDSNPDTVQLVCCQYGAVLNLMKKMIIGNRL
jgi:hypothetical protein